MSQTNFTQNECANKIKSIYIDKYAQKYPNLISNKS